jgi:DNA-binding response OmpR family regulator
VAVVCVVEDDDRIREALTRGLRSSGHAVRENATGLTGLRQIVDDPPDVVVLDLGLPDIDGYELVKMIRAVSQVPVIAATARDDEEEIVRTLDAGADDYVVKPFSASQIDARIRAVLRRGGSAGSPVARVGGLTVDPGGRTAVVEGRSLELTRKEFDLLYLLASRPGRVVSKRQLLAEVWDQPLGGDDKTVDVHISWLRRKLGESAGEPRYIRTVRGGGVKLVDPSE